MGYTFWLPARVLLYAPSNRQDSTYHSLCYTSHGALAGTRNSPMGPPWRIDPMIHRTKTSLCCYLERVAHVVAAGFLSHSLNGPLPYVWYHITINKNVFSAFVKWKKILLLSPMMAEKFLFLLGSPIWTGQCVECGLLWTKGYGYFWMNHSKLWIQSPWSIHGTNPPSPPPPPDWVIMILYEKKPSFPAQWHSRYIISKWAGRYREKCFI